MRQIHQLLVILDLEKLVSVHWIMLFCFNEVCHWKLLIFAVRVRCFYNTGFWLQSSALSQPFMLCSSYGLDDGKFENEHLPSNISDPGQVSVSIVQTFFVTFNLNSFINLRFNFYVAWLVKDCTCCVRCWGGYIHCRWNHTWTQGRHFPLPMMFVWVHAHLCCRFLLFLHPWFIC